MFSVRYLSLLLVGRVYGPYHSIGFIMDHCVRKINVGGRELTGLLIKLLQGK